MLKAKDIADLLGVETVTVRKYSAALERHGYIVRKDGNGNRLYDEQDATLYKDLKALRDRSGMPLDKCAEVIASRVKEASGSVAPSIVKQDTQAIDRLSERYDDLLGVTHSLTELAARQASEIERLHTRMDQQNAGISEVLREIQAARREIAADRARKWWQFWIKEAPAGPDPEAAWKRKQDPEDYIK